VVTESAPLSALDLRRLRWALRQRPCLVFAARPDVEDHLVAIQAERRDDRVGLLPRCSAGSLEGVEVLRGVVGAWSG